MQNFVVCSYDDDQQQWFYDTVRAENTEDAAALVCKLRPYVMAADALSIAELGVMVKQAKTRKPKAIEKHLDEIAVESGFQTRCENCQVLYREGDLDDIRHYHERVAEGEEEPVGQCPAADCGALCHLIPGAK
jgi:hypothetical protein